MPLNFPRNPGQDDSPKSPGIFESFMAGMKNPHLNADQWGDSRLTPEEWMQKYPGTTIKDYRRWMKSLKPKRHNWLQKMLFPRSVMRNFRNVR